MFEDIIGKKETEKEIEPDIMYICIIGPEELWANCRLYKCSPVAGGKTTCDFYRLKGSCASGKNPSENRII